MILFYYPYVTYFWTYPKKHKNLTPKDHFRRQIFFFTTSAAKIYIFPVEYHPTVQTHLKADFYHQQKELLRILKNEQFRHGQILRTFRVITCIILLNHVHRPIITCVRRQYGHESRVLCHVSSRIVPPLYRAYRLTVHHTSTSRQA